MRGTTWRCYRRDVAVGVIAETNDATVRQRYYLDPTGGIIAVAGDAAERVGCRCYVALCVIRITDGTSIYATALTDRFQTATRVIRVVHRLNASELFVDWAALRIDFYHGLTVQRRGGGVLPLAGIVDGRECLAVDRYRIRFCHQAEQVARIAQCRFADSDHAVGQTARGFDSDVGRNRRLHAKARVRTVNRRCYRACGSIKNRGAIGFDQLPDPGVIWSNSCFEQIAIR